MSRGFEGVYLARLNFPFLFGALGGLRLGSSVGTNGFQGKKVFSFEGGSQGDRCASERETRSTGWKSCLIPDRRYAGRFPSSPPL